MRYGIASEVSGDVHNTYTTRTQNVHNTYTTRTHNTIRTQPVQYLQPQISSVSEIRTAWDRISSVMSN